MVTQDGAPGTSSTLSRYYWLRTVAAAFVAGLVAIVMSIVARKEAWPYPQSIAFASFLFLIPVLQPILHNGRRRSWLSRLGFGVVYGLIGGMVHAFVLNR
jgi:hypothetical protein